MPNDKGIRYFLGANSAEGFYSLFDDFTDPEKGDFLWVIKGGPGCGKSSFMKKIADAAQGAGLTVERILCSGDPSSLDGIYLREARCAYVDGTAPHAQELKMPGVTGLYLDLGEFYEAGALQKKKEELSQLYPRYQAQYTRAYALLQAAALAEEVPLLSPALRRDVTRRAEAMARRWLPQGDGGREKRRFLSAYTCEGEIFLWETAALCPRVCTLDNELSLAPIFLECIRHQCQERGLGAVVCLSPLKPSQLEAVLLPEAGLSFVAVSRARPYPGEVWRHLRLDAMAEAETGKESRTLLRQAARRKELLLSDAVQALAGAKKLHDELEEIYHPYMDFEALSSLCEAHTDYLLGLLE